MAATSAAAEDVANGGSDSGGEKELEEEEEEAGGDVANLHMQLLMEDEELGTWRLFPRTSLKCINQCKRRCETMAKAQCATVACWRFRSFGAHNRVHDHTDSACDSPSVSRRQSHA